MKIKDLIIKFFEVLGAGVCLRGCDCFTFWSYDDVVKYVNQRMPGISSYTDLVPYNDGIDPSTPSNLRKGVVSHG